MTGARVRRTARWAGTNGTTAMGLSRVAVAIERAQVDRVDRAAGRTARPQQPIADSDGGADCRRPRLRKILAIALIAGSLLSGRID